MAFREILAGITFGEMARNHLDKNLVNLNLAIHTIKYKRYCVCCVSQKMETYEVDSCVRGHHVFRGIWTPTYRQGRDNRLFFPLEKSVQLHL